MPRQKIFLVGFMKNQILGSKLPSKRDVLSVLFYNMRIVNLTLQDSVSLVIDECLIFWKKARIPTRDRSHCLKQLKKIYKELRNLEKNKNRNSELCRQREHTFEETLNDLFDIAHASALNKMKINEDKEFLILQRQKNRPGCTLGTGLKLAGVGKRRYKREIKLSRVRQEESSSPKSNEVEFTSTSCSEEEETITDITFSVPTPQVFYKKRARLDILTPRLSAVLDKCKISDRDAVHLLTACVEAIELNPLDFVINRTSIRRSRQKFRKSIASNIKLKFSDLNLNFTTIHWDSKLLPDITGKTKVDRLPIIATASNTEQLLGVPELTSGTGYEVSSAIYDTLEDWSLLSNVQAFVFDTTASNTGRLNGACILLEHKLGRDILYLACRHHIFEIILQSVFVGSKFSPSSGPDIPLFKRFKNQWETINTSQFSIWSMDVKTNNVLNDIRQDILIFAQKKLLDDFPRDDYKEFLQSLMI